MTLREKEIAIGVATQYKEIKFPVIYISGSQGQSSGGLLETLIGASLAQKMLPE